MTMTDTEPVGVLVTHHGQPVALCADQSAAVGWLLGRQSQTVHRATTGGGP